MFDRILVPIDLSESGPRVVAMAAEMARRFDGRLTLLHVIELVSGLDLEEGASFYGPIEEAALARLGEHASLADDGHPIEARVVYGRRSAEIIRIARDEGADLIVLGSPPIDPSDPNEGLGTLRYRVGVLAPCPVLLVR